MKALRWSDNDRYFGPFTYARDKRGYRPFAIMLGSGDDGDYPHCRLRLSGFGRTLIVRLPAIIRPASRWVDTSHYGWSNNPAGGYWDKHEREFGFTYSEGHLSFHYGAQTSEWPGTKSRGFLLPWKQWRHSRHSLYDLSGKLFADMPEGRRFIETYDWRKALENACPAAAFEFDDFDGERIVATTRIEEREWLFGEGWFKWLSLFRRPRVRRSLDIHFSAETGKRKGSWKGGTIGHSIDMLPGELHEAAFRRYCAEHNMSFIASCDTHPKGGDVKHAPAPLSGPVANGDAPKASR